MKFYKILFSGLIIGAGFLLNSSSANSGLKLKSLFNGKNLDGWDTYLGPPMLDNGKHQNEVPLGLNKDPQRVFSVVKEDGMPCIRISGQAWGGLISKVSYENFHIQLKFKWGKLQWGPKKNKKKDSGLLYYSVGDLGADYGAWMRSQEFQIEEGNCGEFWGVSGGSEDIHAQKINDSSYVYDKDAPLLQFNSESPQGRYCRKSLDNENPTGEWNTLDLYCLNGKSIHRVNEKVMMVLENSSQMNNHILSPLKEGKIQIQSEGCEIFYRDILIEPIQKLSL